MLKATSLSSERLKSVTGTLLREAFLLPSPRSVTTWGGGGSVRVAGVKGCYPLCLWVLLAFSFGDGVTWCPEVAK